MANPIRVKTNETPTYLNKDAVLGGLAGWVAGGAISIATGIPALGLLGAAVMTPIGAAAGKKRMQDELLHGKEVHKPSFWNKDTAIGGLIGASLSLIAAAAVGVAGLVTAVSLSGTAGGAVAIATIPAMLAAAAGTIGIGTYIGGRMGRSRMEEEYQEARTQEAQQMVARGQAMSLANEIERHPERAQDMVRNFAEQIEKERALETAQVTR